MDKIIAFILYFVVVLEIGIYFFFKSKGGDEKEYFLGGRHMGPFVTAMSAQASDMSGWLLMGFPGSLFAFGMPPGSAVSQRQQVTRSHYPSISRTDLQARARC